MRSRPKSLDILNNQNGAKSIFCSLTFWSLVLLSLEGVATHIETVLTDGHLGVRDIFSIIRIIAATSAGFLGRYNADSIVWTPSGLPGRDRDRAETLVSGRANSEEEGGL